MDDLISRQAAIEALDDVLVEDDSCKVWFKLALKQLPSAERRGKKKVFYHGENGFSYLCDQCAMPIDGNDAFCRWCGARMEV